jgi:heat shock protein HslJ
MRVRALPLAILAATSLLMPAAAFAGGSPTTPVRSFVIQGLTLGDQKVEASGKLAIEGSQLMASVGCNSIGGSVTLDGDVLTIPEPLVMTEMACPGVNGDVEAMLIKVLQRGPFRITTGAWIGDGASIIVEELPAGPGPGATAPAPDDPITSEPDPGTTDPSASCTPGAGGPDTGSGTSGSSGSGSGTSGSAPGDAPGSVVGSGGGSTSVDTPPAPPAVSPEAGVSDEQAPPEPGSDPQVVIDPGFDPSGVLDRPVTADPCVERFDAVAAGPDAGAIPPKAVDNGAELASTADADAAPSILLLGAGILIVALVTLLAIRLWRVGAVPAGPGEDRLG